MSPRGCSGGAGATIWLAALLLAGGVAFLSWVASVLYTPIVFHVLVMGSVIGGVASRQFGWKVFVYVPAGILGAFVGALLTFGDGPLLMRHPYLNPWTVSVVTAVLLVTVLGTVDEIVTRP